MKLNELKPNEGSRRNRKRVGRGTSSGYGKTAGRGQKGQKARSKTRVGFEGGQMPLYRRIPKRGFTNINRKEFAIVNLASLNKFDDGADVTSAALVEAGLVKNEKSGVKILGNGQLTTKIDVEANAFSKTAEEAIKALGGNTTII